MKRFDFRLEKALEVRSLKKLLAEEKLGQAKRAEMQTRGLLGRAREEREECFREIRGNLRGKVEPDDMRRLLRYESSIEDEIWRQKMDLSKKEAATKNAMDVVVERTKEERALTKHRENLMREYKADYWWEEGKTLDEVGTTRYLREKGGERD